MNTSRARRTRPSPGTFAPVSAAQRAGGQAEDRALDYLLARGLRLVERNFRLPIGELDLVMAEADELVFVEVRQRTSDRYGGAAASVTPAKQGRVRRTAQVFLALRWGAQRWPAVRFDVVAIDGPAGAGHGPSAVGSSGVDWIRGAF
jgi:putative endonuclease